MTATIWDPFLVLLSVIPAGLVVLAWYMVSYGYPIKPKTDLGKEMLHVRKGLFWFILAAALLMTLPIWAVSLIALIRGA